MYRNTLKVVYRFVDIGGIIGSGGGGSQLKYMIALVWLKDHASTMHIIINICLFVRIDLWM